MIDKEYKLTENERKMMGRRINSLRRLCGMRKGELAEKVGISPSSLTHFLNGERQPSDEILQKIADVLNTHTSFLLFGTGSDSLFDMTAVRSQSLQQNVKLYDNFWNNLTATEKTYVVMRTAGEINHFRMKNIGGLSFDDLKSCVCNSIPAGLFPFDDEGRK
ncbi:MAG: helix-turn-helix transcriptional regulator [Lachnospiraceae bacterium]|nr:helix-turn-helix transcriptional regulator [Lachnospiraceae bacterium]